MMHLGYSFAPAHFNSLEGNLEARVLPSLPSPKTELQSVTFG